MILEFFNELKYLMEKHYCFKISSHLEIINDITWVGLKFHFMDEEIKIIGDFKQNFEFAE